MIPPSFSAPEPGLQPGPLPGAAGSTAAARDRRGRGPRSPIFPAHVPGFRTRSELFDQVVMDAVADVELRWPNRLTHLEFAVDDVPALRPERPEGRDDEVVDEGVPLARFYPPGVDRKGKSTKARVVVFRRPLEMRAPTQPELLELVTEVLTQQLTAVFGEAGE